MGTFVHSNLSQTHSHRHSIHTHTQTHACFYALISHHPKHPAPWPLKDFHCNRSAGETGDYLTNLLAGISLLVERDEIQPLNRQAFWLGKEIKSVKICLIGFTALNFSCHHTSPWQKMKIYILQSSSISREVSDKIPFWREYQLYICLGVQDKDAVINSLCLEQTYMESSGKTVTWYPHLWVSLWIYVVPHLCMCIFSTSMCVCVCNWEPAP